MIKKKLGIDIGGVIIDRINNAKDTSFFGENFLLTKSTKGAFTAIRELCNLYQGEVFLVSKCGQKTQEKTLAWLSHHDFFKETRLKSEQVLFCRERHQKDGICQDLGISTFIDDRLEVLSYLQTVNKKYLFMPDLLEKKRFQHWLHQVHEVNSWQDVLIQETNH